jgi:cytoskeletal protein RodZ
VNKIFQFWYTLVKINSKLKKVATKINSKLKKVARKKDKEKIKKMRDEKRRKDFGKVILLLFIFLLIIGFLFYKFDRKNSQQNGQQRQENLRERQERQIQKNFSNDEETNQITENYSEQRNNQWGDDKLDPFYFNLPQWRKDENGNDLEITKKSVFY